MAWFGAILGLVGAGVSSQGQAKAGRRAKRAFGINASGDVVGTFIDAGGTVHGFLARRTR